MQKFLIRFKTAQTGQSLPEYATILALVTLFCVGSLYVFSDGIAKFMGNVSSFITAMPIAGP